MVKCHKTTIFPDDWDPRFDQMPAPTCSECAILYEKCGKPPLLVERVAGGKVERLSLQDAFGPKVDFGELFKNLRFPS